MRENWNRATELFKLSNEELHQLVAPVYANNEVVGQRPTSGGLANTNIEVRLKDEPHVCLVRVYVRDPLAAEKEFAINQLVRQRVPSPTFHHLELSHPALLHPYTVMDWVDGERLEAVVGAMTQDEQLQCAKSIGRALAGIHSFKFAQGGFLDGNLDVCSAAYVTSDGLKQFAQQCLSEGIGAERLSPAFLASLLDFIDEYAVLLDSVSDQTTLTHSDFGGSNILMHKRNDVWVVAAVLDWEFAFSGTVYCDLGNLLRPPLGDLPGFAAAVINGFTESGGRIHPHWKELSLLSDLFAWFEFCARPSAGEQVVGDARASIERTMRFFENLSTANAPDAAPSL